MPNPGHLYPAVDAPPSKADGSSQPRANTSKNLEILLNLLNMNFQRSTTTQTGPGLGYVGAASAMQAVGGGLGAGMATPTLKAPTNQAMWEQFQGVI